MSELPWATPLRSYRCRIGWLTWQPVLGHAWNADLVIVPHVVRFPAAILLQFLRGLTTRKHAFWGHGINNRPVFARYLTEACKRTITVTADWWFAYNDHSARSITDLGFPEERITSVMNSIDMDSLRDAHDNLSEADVQKARDELGITCKNVAVYTGSLRELKRPDFLIAACEKIRALVPDFEMIVIGDGPDAPMVAAAAARWPWFHYVGRKNDVEKVPYWALAKLLLMPGGVGLVVLDSFALGIPMVTTENHFHGPEIDYLKDGVNGIMVKPGDDPARYAEEVAALLRDDTKREAMAAAALSERDRYSSEDMSQRFAEGVLAALKAPRHRLFL